MKEKVMHRTTTNRQIILCSLIGLLFGFAASLAKAEGMPQHIELLSYSFGVTQGQTARISIILQRLANPRPPDQPVSAVVQLLDIEGEVITESGELKVLPGQTKYWDVPRDLLPTSGEPGGRVQLRVRIRVTTLSADLERLGLMPTIEVIDTITGETRSEAGKRFLIFVSGPGVNSVQSKGSR
jgi:hypothetical protein